MKTISNILTKWKLDALSVAGVDVDKITQSVGISRFEIDKDGGRITQDNHFNLVRETLPYYNLFLNKQKGNIDMHRCFPELFSLCFNEKNAIDALQSFVTYRAIMGDSDLFTFQVNRNQILIEYKSDAPGDISCPAVVGNFYTAIDILRNYISDFDIAVEFNSNPLISKAFINDMFQSNCTFSQSRNTLLITSNQINQPYANFNEKSNELQKTFAHKHLDKINKSYSFSFSLCEMIERILEKNSGESERGILEIISSELKQSRWTINRRLKLENTNFTDLLKRVRINLAHKLLSETNQSMDEISDALGFSSAANFTRFFSSNIGLSPLKYRIMHKFSVIICMVVPFLDIRDLDLIF